MAIPCTAYNDNSYVNKNEAVVLENPYNAVTEMCVHISTIRIYQDLII